MRIIIVIVGALFFAGGFARAAQTQITDPVSFVADVYRHFGQEATASEYEPPDDIYTARLRRLFEADKKRAKGEVGCLDFVFWVNGQDWTLTEVAVTGGAEQVDRKTVIARFRNIGTPEEIHFDFRRVAGHWLLDDASSVQDQRWTLSAILKCRP